MILYKGLISGFVLIFAIFRAQWPRNQLRICSFGRNSSLRTGSGKGACTHKKRLPQKGWLL